MNRREFLGVIGGAGVSSLSGCLNPISEIPSQQVDEGHRQIEEVRQDTQPTEFNVTLDVSVVNRKSTTEEPMTLSVSLTNNNSTDIVIDGSNNEAFSSQLSKNKKLLLVQPTFWESGDIVSDNCWRMRNEKPVLSTSSSSNYRPDESESEVYNLIGSHNSRGCINQGNYRFNTNYQTIVGEGTQRRVNGEFNWGFTVQVSQL